MYSSYFLNSKEKQNAPHAPKHPLTFREGILKHMKNSVKTAFHSEMKLKPDVEKYFSKPNI